jgi:hypothetical protein
MQCRKSISESENIRCPEKSIKDGYCEYHLYCMKNEIRNFNDYIFEGDFEDDFDWNKLINESQSKIKNEFTEISKTIDSTFSDSTNLNLKDLEKFSKDKENVHTAPLVQKTIQISKKLMDLSDQKLTSYDTLVCVLKECKLSDKAQDHMLEHYFSNNSIYELPAPTFKKVLDGLWIYIQEQPSEAKVNLVERLRQELEDNSGTCAQGNLSRLVNTLNGFTHTTEKELSLGDIMKDLMNISDLRTRLTRAIKILKEKNLSDEVFASWIEIII